MTRMIPKDIVDDESETKSGPLKSSLDVDYNVRIRMMILDIDREEDDNSFQSISELTTEIKVVKEDGTRERLVADWYYFNDPLIVPYVPSRVYYDKGQQKFVLLYYTSPVIKVKAFVEPGEFVNVLVARLDPTCQYIYDVRARVVIDQVPGPDGMYLVILFGDDSHDMLMGTKI